MDDERFKLLFGELQKKRPFHGVKKDREDVIASGLKGIDIGDDWYTSVRIGSVGISLQATDLGSSAAER